MRGLTDRQAEALEAIKRGQARGRLVTVRWLCRVLGIRGTQGVHQHLRALTKKGFITRQRAKAGAITVLDPTDPLHDVRVQLARAGHLVRADVVRGLADLPRGECKSS